MKSNSLVYKLVVTFTIILAISYMLIATVLSIWVQRNYIMERRVRLEDSSAFIQNNVARYKNREIDMFTLRETMRFLGKGINNSDIMLLDDRNLIWYVSKPELESELLKVYPSSNLEKLKNGEVQEITGLGGAESKTEYFIFIRPMIENNIYQGSVVILTPESALRDQISGVYIIIWFSALLVMLASVVIIYYFAQRILIKPLYELNEVAGKMKAGDFSQRANISSGDEIGQLGESFNLMAESMENTDKNRRELISNISHELRSPITSIRGFIAGILDGIIPKDKENYYLNLVYEEIQRLTRLINDLLDLSALETGKVSMNITEVELNEIIRVSLIKFETKINDKKLKIDITLDSEHLYVAGDRDRLIQVVTNLLDNAIKHCTEEGNIEVSTKVKGKKVTVSIYNDGTPLNEEETKNIWNRFYKADKSRTKKDSTGLGLPIVRNILTQLNETVWVENKETGVTFLFTLTKT